MDRTEELQNAVIKYFRNLDPRNYNIFYSLHKYSDVIREKSSKFNQEEKSAIYGTLAEEVAYYLLRMYQASGAPIEILHSLVFEYDNDKNTTEIDLIAVTPNMVYIFEVKHRSNDITVKEDGTFISKYGDESPINQNIYHIRKLFANAGYGNTVPQDRVLNIVFLMLNNCKVTNPTTLFKKEGFNGAFTGIKNLLPLINKFETERNGGRIPYQKFTASLRKLDLGEEGMKTHIKNIKRRNSK